MKKRLLGILSMVLLITNCFAQTRSLPSVNVKTLEGSSMNILKLENNGNPIRVCRNRRTNNDF